MGTRVSVDAAKDCLAELVQRAADGEDIVLTWQGTAVVRLSGITPEPQRKLGRHPEILVDTQELLAPLDPEELAEWE